MPELPEVETVRRGLEPALVGRRIAGIELRRPDLRVPFPKDFAAKLVGARVEALRRRAKYLLADLSSGEVLVMHLGMTGRFRVERPGGPDREGPGGPDRESPAAEGRPDEPGAFYHEVPPHPAHDHVVLRLDDGVRVVYNDVRRFGFMALLGGAELDNLPPFDAMGIEPLGPGLDGAALARLFAGRRTPLKAALLDQRLVAGLGNIYVCEALFRARLSPEAPAGSLATPTGRPRRGAAALAAAIRDVLTEAVAHGGSTLRDHAQVSGEAGAFQERFRVYDRAGQPCVTPGCRAIIRRSVQAGRSTFSCPDCQRG